MCHGSRPRRRAADSTDDREPTTGTDRSTGRQLDGDAGGDGAGGDDRRDGVADDGDGGIPVRTPVASAVLAPIRRLWAILG